MDTRKEETELKKPYQTPNQHEYDGILLAGRFRADTIDKIRNEFIFHPNDLILVAYPKSGSTWAQTILYLIHHPEALEAEEIKAQVDKTVMFIERGDLPPDVQDPEDIPPRLLKTHLLHRFVGPKVNKAGTKVLVMMRNPKDALVSFYHFYRMNKGLGNFPGTWNEFYDLFLNDQLVFGNWFDYTLGWWSEKDNPNYLFVHYEDMKKDAEPVVEKMAEFYGKPLTPEQCKKLVQMTSFDSMKINQNLNKQHVPHFDNSISPFMRKGEVGDWKNYFTVAQSEQFDAMYTERMAGSGLTFQYEV